MLKKRLTNGYIGPNGRYLFPQEKSFIDIWKVFKDASGLDQHSIYMSK